MAPMRLLFLENDDSFSWNVIDRLPVERPRVRIVQGADRAAWESALAESDLLVVGPGPLDPIRAGIVDAVRMAAARKLPTLGICLGHQAIGLAFGAELVRVVPHHGVRDQVEFTANRLFPGFHGAVEVMRYHSLALGSIAPPLRVVATTADGLPMAIEHASLPIAGLQFHPDSFGTPRGEELIAAFFRAVA